MFNCSYLLLMYKRLGLLSFDDDDRRRWLDLRTKSFKTLYLSRALCWKKNICIYCMREVCAFLGDWGKNGPFVFMNLFVSHLVYLLILNLCIYWISIYVFLDLCNSFFRGCCEACVCREGCSWDQDKKRRCQTNVFKEKNTNLKTVVTWDRERK